MHWNRLWCLSHVRQNIKGRNSAHHTSSRCSISRSSHVGMWLLWTNWFFLHKRTFLRIASRLQGEACCFLATCHVDFEKKRLCPELIRNCHWMPLYCDLPSSYILKSTCIVVKMLGLWKEVCNSHVGSTCRWQQVATILNSESQISSSVSAELPYCSSQQLSFYHLTGVVNLKGRWHATVTLSFLVLRFLVYVILLS